MSKMPHGFNAQVIHGTAPQNEYISKQTIGINPTKVVPAGGAIADNNGFTIMELYFFEYTKEEINKINGGPIRREISRFPSDSAGLYFAKHEFGKNGSYTKSPELIKAPTSFDNSEPLYFPCLIAGNTDRSFEYNYGSVNGKYFTNYQLANLINHHICLYEGYDGGIIAIPYN